MLLFLSDMPNSHSSWINSEEGALVHEAVKKQNKLKKKKNTHKTSPKLMNTIALCYSSLNWMDRQTRLQ